MQDCAKARSAGKFYVGPLNPSAKSIMKSFLVIVASLLLCSCGAMNYYEGDDAALISRSCGPQPVTGSMGKEYSAYISLIEVDGTFTGSAHACPHEFTYRIKPGMRRVTVIPNLDNASESFLLYGHVDVTAELKPKMMYELSAFYTGMAVGVRITESLSGREVARGETSEIKRSGKGNAALKVIPLMVK